MGATVRTGRRAALATLVVGFAGCAMFAALAAAVYDAVTEADGVAAIDQPVLDAALRLRRPGLTDVVDHFTDLGGTLGLTIIVVIAALLLAAMSRSAQPVVVAAVTAAGSVSMTVIGKVVVGRGRPPFVDAVPPFQSSFSFPSGHSLNSMALIGVLTYLAVRHWRHRWAKALTVVVSSLFVVAMGLSRVYLGHHWLTDVLGAWFVASAWLTVVVTSHLLYLRASRARRRPAPARSGRVSPPTQHEADT